MDCLYLYQKEGKNIGQRQFSTKDSKPIADLSFNSDCCFRGGLKNFTVKTFRSFQQDSSGAVRFRGPETVFHFFVLASCVLVVILSFLLQYDGQELQLFGIGWPLSCGLYQTFGIKCALCGLTRSFCSMAKGEFFAATHFHAVGPAIFIFVCLQIPYRIYALWTGHSGQEKLKRACIYSVFGLASALLINWFIYLGGLVL